jgi:CubicO group peptidase (beta-lactamase class C family)
MTIRREWTRSSRSPSPSASGHRDPRPRAPRGRRLPAVFAAGAVFVLVGGCLSAPPDPARERFSASGLEEVTSTLQAAVDRGDLGGIVTLIFHDGEVAQVDAVGIQDPDARTPMARDSIFRIASMTKPITAVATLILVDEGKIALDDPVDRWLPELAHPKVLSDPSAPLHSGTPSPRPIRVIDLLTHRSGIVTPRDAPGPLRDALTEADANNSAGYDRWIGWIGELPLAHVPGSTYTYGNSFDVLGILVERVSGMKYPDFLRERIFEPLGMKDTAFRVPPEKRARFARLQSLGRVPASWIPSEETVPGFPAGAGGLYSTVDDYLAFARMLFNRGELGGVRILAPETVDAMTTDHLTAEQRKGEPFAGHQGFWNGQGFGLGVAVKLSPTVHASELGMASVGSFGWPGVFGTWWQADRAKDLILVFMVPGGDADATRWAFQKAVHDAIER